MPNEPKHLESIPPPSPRERVLLWQNDNIARSNFVNSPKVGTSRPESSQLPARRHLTEEERRSASYNTLVEAQRSYAEKLTTPSGIDGRFTKEEYNTMVDRLSTKDWEAAFLGEEFWMKENRPPGTGNEKGKERAMEESDDEDAPSLMMDLVRW